MQRRGASAGRGRGRAPAVALALALSVVPVALSAAGGASGIFVNILAPADGAWTANATGTVWGTVGALGNTTQRIDSPAELSSGSFDNTSFDAGTVALKPPPFETWAYTQDFTGLTGVSRIDGHWPAKISDTAWVVGAYSLLGETAPSLYHTGTRSEKVFWNVVLPGPLVNGSLSFRYACAATGNLTVGLSPTGFAAAEVPLLGTGSAAQTTLNYSLAPTFAGTRSFVVRFTARATNATTSACAVDNFSFYSEYTPSAANPTFTFTDDFASGLNAQWDLSDGQWQVSGPTDYRGTSDPPGLLHTGTARTSAYLNLAFAAPIRNATLSFAYRTNYYGRISAYLGGDGSGDGQILPDSDSYMTSTTFFQDIAPIVMGGHNLRLRFDGTATLSSWNESGVDDIVITVETEGAAVDLWEGDYTGPVMDASVPVTLDAVTWSTAVPSGAWAGHFVRASSDGTNWGPFLPVQSNGSSPVASLYRFFQVRTNFTAPAASPPVRLEWYEIRFHGIAELSWSYGGGPWSNLPLQSPWTLTSNLVGGANSFSVRARDTTGASAQRNVTLNRDTFAPGAPGVPVGPAITAATSATWTWTPALDTGVGVDHYVVDAGTTPGGSDVVSGQSIKSPAYTIAVLPETAHVYFRVRAVDGAGLEGPTAASAVPTVVDRVAPGGFAFRRPGPYLNTSTIDYNWSEPTEVGSWVAYYIVTVGTAAGSANVAQTTVNTTSFEVTDALSGRRYYATAQAVDAAGNRGPLVSSTGTLIDLDAPGPPGALSQGPEWSRSPSVGWTWGAATDALTGIGGYRVHLGTAAGSSDVEVTDVSSRAYTFDTLVDGTAYFVSVSAVDLAGNEGPAVSAGPVRVDLTGPQAVTLPTLPAFVRVAALTIEWPIPSDRPGSGASGVDQYEVTIVEGGASRTQQRLANYTQLSLRDGLDYVVKVAAIDRAGNRGDEASLNFTVDMAGPAPPREVAAEGPAEAGLITVDWQPAVDAASGVLEYHVIVGTQEGADDVLADRTQSAPSVTFGVEPGNQYFVTVWAVDKAGNVGPAAHAGPITVHAPSAIAVGGPSSLLFVLAGAGVAAAAGVLLLRLIPRRSREKRPR